MLSLPPEVWPSGPLANKTQERLSVAKALAEIPDVAIELPRHNLARASWAGMRFAFSDEEA